MDNYEINTVADLVRAVMDQKTGGYDVDFNILPNRYRAGPDAFWLVIEVDSNHPDTNIGGQYWFWADNTVMQVL